MDLILSGHRLVNRAGYLLTVIAIFAVNCAEIGAPPGGEADKSPPYIIASIPANGTVEVPPGNTVEVFFSERVVKPLSGTGIFISPRPRIEPKLKWKSDHLNIIFADSFATDQTYIISVSPEVKDLRNNGLDSASIIAFSTSVTIDSGRISGVVYNNDRPQAAALVGLFDPISISDPVSIDSVYPAYVAKTNQGGMFSFAYLPEKEFGLIAFIDQNRSERFNPTREQFAVPDRPVVVGGELPLDKLVLPITRLDTLTPEIISASQTPDGLIKLRFSAPVSLDLLAPQPSNFMLRRADDSTVSIPARALLESNIDKSATVHFYAGVIDTGRYILQLTFDAARPAIEYPDFVVEAFDDTRPPTLEQFSPTSQPQFLEQLLVEARFSEPIDTGALTGETFELWDADNERVAADHHWEDPFKLRFDTDRLDQGARYRLVIAEFEVRDLNGNLLGDSLREYSISIIDSDSVGSVSGEIEIMLEPRKADPVRLTLTKLDTKQVFEFAAEGHEFKAVLPAGKYQLSGFIDSDLDGDRGMGSFFPYRFSESSAVYPDTIAVRARFETTGILLVFD